MSSKSQRGFSSSRHRIPLGFFVLVISLAVMILVLWQGGIQFRNYVSIRRRPADLHTAWENQEYQKALRLSKEIFQDNPMSKSALVYAGLSSFYIGVNQINLEEKIPYMESAVIYLRKALLVQSNPYLAETLYVLGKAYHERGDFYADKALHYLLAAREQGYSANDIDEYLGSAAYKLKQYKASIGYFQRVTEKKESPAVYKKIGEIYYHINDWDQAESYYRKALDLAESPRFSLQTRAELGQLYQKMKNWENAIVQYERILDNEPENAEIHFQLGECYYHNQEIARARAEWRNTVQIDPEHHGALTRLYN